MRKKRIPPVLQLLLLPGTSQRVRSVRQCKRNASWVLCFSPPGIAFIIAVAGVVVYVGVVLLAVVLVGVMAG